MWFVGDVSKERNDLLYLCRVFWGCTRIQNSMRPPRQDWGQLKNPVKENLKRKIFASFRACLVTFPSTWTVLWPFDWFTLTGQALTFIDSSYWWFKSRFTVSSSPIRFKVCTRNLIKCVSLKVCNDQHHTCRSGWLILIRAASKQKRNLLQGDKM